MRCTRSIADVKVSEMAEEKECAHCGMDVSLGSERTDRHGKHYCCKGCADETGCTCLLARALQVQHMSARLQANGSRALSSARGLGVVQNVRCSHTMHYPFRMD